MSSEDIKDKDLKNEEDANETGDVADTAEAVSESGKEASSEENRNGETENEQAGRIQELEKELAAQKDATLRKAAELENVRKRVKRERVQLFEEAKAGALEDFMPIYDDLARSLQAAEESKVEDSFLEGVKMVSSKFQNVLEKHGVERIDQTGVPFDVNLHDAMLRQPAPDKDTASDTVLQVLESGYKIGNRTIRHAKVIVSE